jgi:DNA-binding CsgD family transcriptional regulator
MQTLSILQGGGFANDDIEQLNRSIFQLYTLRDLDTFGLDALSIVDRLVPGELPMFHINHGVTPKLDYDCLGGFRLTVEMERTMHQHFSSHPIVDNMPQTLTGTYKISDFVTQEELHQFEGLYQQFLRLYQLEDQMVLFLPDVNPDSWQKLSQLNTKLVGFTQNRTQRNFTERDRLILNLLRPHLAQSYTNVQQYYQLQQENQQLQQSLNHLGTIVLDSQQQIVSISPQAIVWLETYFAKSTYSHQQLPDRLQSWLRYQVDCLTHNSALMQVYLPLKIQCAARELTIRLMIEPHESQYLLLLTEQTLSSLNSLVSLGLSQRETEVLKLIIQGKDNKTIAAQLSVNISTIRKHLENIYTKFGVKSRTEAIAHTLKKLGFF